MGIDFVDSVGAAPSGASARPGGIPSVCSDVAFE
jgi:hypothetical protein